ncbi:MAG: LamG domain-containing protein, partial [Myxococcota bacterium]
AFLLRIQSSTNAPWLLVSDDEADQTFEDSSNVRCEQAPDLTPNQWHHLAGQYDRSARTLRLWVDGTKQCELTTTGGDGLLDQRTTEVSLGVWRAPSTDVFFQGIIDEMRVYDRALNEDEILRDLNGDL